MGFSSWGRSEQLALGQAMSDSQTPQSSPEGKSPKKNKKKVKMKGGIKKKVADMDQDGDGKVDLSEFIAAGGTEEGFRILDADGSGFIDQAELDAALAAGTLDEEAPAGDAAAGEGYLITLSPKSIKQQCLEASPANQEGDPNRFVDKVSAILQDAGFRVRLEDETI